ncbi:hypothetical protein IIA79_04530 [bacterium]|nr:hypothetical protein [bacterium]
MTALTESRYTKHRDGLISAHPVKGITKIYKGSLVTAATGGYAVPGSDTANEALLGVALEEADNSSGADGDITVRVQTYGVFSFAKSGTITQANVGDTLYIFDDQTVALITTTTNDIPCGQLEGLDGSDVWARIQL